MSPRAIILLGAAVILPFLYAGLFLACSGLPFQDLPNHLARAYVIKQLLVNPASMFGTYFKFEFQFAPFILGDLLVASTLTFMSAVQAGVFWQTVAALAFPGAVLFYLNAAGQPRGYILPCVFIALYVSTGPFLLSGYLHFQLALAVTFFTFGVVELLSAAEAENGRAPLLLWLIYFLSVPACFLLHFTAFVMLTISIAALCMRRVWKHRYTVPQAFFRLLPLIVVASYHLSENRQMALLGEFSLKAALAKLAAFEAAFIRYGYFTDTMLFSGLSAILLATFAISRAKTRNMALQSETAREMVYLAMAAIVCFVLLPIQAGSAVANDSFAVPYILTFLTAAVFHERGELSQVERAYAQRTLSGQGREGYMFTFSALLAALNLVYLTETLLPLNEQAQDIQHALNAVEPGRKMLPVLTLAETGSISPYAQIGALYTPLRGGVTPYLFSATNRKPFPFFSYRVSLYTPASSWYTNTKGHLDIEQTKVDFDYLFVTRPYDAQRLGVEQILPLIVTMKCSVFQIRK